MDVSLQKALRAFQIRNGSKLKIACMGSWMYTIYLFIVYSIVIRLAL